MAPFETSESCDSSCDEFESSDSDSSISDDSDVSTCEDTNFDRNGGQ